MLIRDGKIKNNGPSYIFSRNFKHFNNEQFMKSITEHPLYMEALTDNDPNEIAKKNSKYIS